jgi:hypothetical protein
MIRTGAADNTRHGGPHRRVTPPVCGGERHHSDIRKFRLDAIDRIWWKLFHSARIPLAGYGFRR